MSNANANANAILDAYFGTPINPLSFSAWLLQLDTQLATENRRWLCGHHNLHSLYQLHSNAAVRTFYQRCDDCYIDGNPVKFIFPQVSRSHSEVFRFTLMDHFTDLLAEAEKKNWSIFYLGSEQTVVAAAIEKLESEYPALKIQLRDGYGGDSTEWCHAINDMRPDLLMVGMGMPRQEQWLLAHLDDLDVGIALQTGGTLDYFVGAQAKPPLWLSRIGFAWLYRLFANPGKLWRRYLWEPWALLIPTARMHFQVWRLGRETR
ncbi:MAG: N-acetylglucosaminyldiphosphoundecaprenol N-acetyl-beta-D-mannosaminyltransferase [Halioglobus sp.]|jgi:N-acetylglucosaminyldiphosphoundecaprenol N-acetyl-beta-D-mannosaminyltransferase